MISKPASRGANIGSLWFSLLLASTLLHGEPLLMLLNAPSTLVLGVTFGIIGYLIFGTRSRLLASELQVALLEREQAEQRQRLLSTELKLLQAQIEPHFLFNTLSNIQSLIHHEPAKADAMLEQLTVLLRGSLAGTRRDSATVSEELALVRAYLDIQQIRMGDRLRYRVTADPGVASLKLPPLLLQPLVENAISHGIERRPGPGTVHIEVGRVADQLRLTVTDDGPGLNADHGVGQSAEHGTALRNIRERLQSGYGDRAGLRLFEAQPQGVRAELALPLDEPGTAPA